MENLNIPPERRIIARKAVALEKWAGESYETREDYRSRARQEREQNKSKPTVMQQALWQDQVALERAEAEMGPLGIASMDGDFPAQPLLVEKFQEEHGFYKTVAKFKHARGIGDKHGSIYTAPLADFDTPLAQVPPVKICRGGTCC